MILGKVDTNPPKVGDDIANDDDHDYDNNNVVDDEDDDDDVGCVPQILQHRSSKGRRCQLSPGISLYSEPDNESTQVATFRGTFKTSSSYRQTPFQPVRPSIKMITVRGDQGQDQSRLSYEGSSSHNHSHTCFVCTHTTLII